MFSTSHQIPSTNYQIPVLERSLPLARALLLRQNVAAIDPNLHADHAVGRARFREAVLDVGAQRMQRQTALQVPLRARDFVSVQPARAAHLDALAAEAQRRV